MENKELSATSGLVTYTINGTCKLTFNPTDSLFAKKLFDAFDELDTKQEEYKAKVERTANKREIFDTAREMDKDARHVMENAFGFDICTELYGSMSVYALADGLPVWVNLMLAIMDEIETGYAKEQKMTNQRIKKYSEKYHR